MRATLPTHLILHFIIRIILDEEYKSCRPSLRSLLYAPVTLSHLNTHIFPETFPQTPPATVPPAPSFTPIQNNRHSYSSVYFIFIFLYHKLEYKRFCTDWYQAFHGVNQLLIYSWMKFWFVRIASMTVPPFQRVFTYLYVESFVNIPFMKHGQVITRSFPSFMPDQT
jgi:hypothetical protein